MNQFLIKELKNEGKAIIKNLFKKPNIVNEITRSKLEWTRSRI